MHLTVRVIWNNERHTTCSLFAGPDEGHTAKCGELTMTNDEFGAFCKTLQLGTECQPWGAPRLDTLTFDLGGS
jgi:hypothetical protein